VAFNVYLDTEDVKVARKIGKAIRHSSGGLRYVKGLGMLVDGKAQVSMNLTNFEATPVYRVVEMIRREAARYGAHITHSELIGMIPQQALVDAAVWYLQLDEFSNDQILETRINQEVAAEVVSGRDEFLHSLAAPTPTPGGGSAAAQAGAMAAALTSMVAGVTVGKKKYANVETEMKRTVEKAQELQEKLSASVEKDAAAFDQVMAAYKLPKGTDEEKQARGAAIREATLKAAEAPLEVAERSVAVLNLVRFVAEHGNANAISDAGSAAALAQTAFNGAAMNVRINLSGLTDIEEGGEMKARLDEMKQQATGLLAAIRSAIESRGGIKGLDL
jgi:glutamate formiminotransferase/formiminotetrahydrofolate cyclodeaminase